MSISIWKNDTELMKLEPLEFRRVYALTNGEEAGVTHLKYSHTDCICKLDDSRVMVEIVQGLITESGDYIIKSDTNLEFKINLTKNVKSLNYLKKIVFMLFPDITTIDMYSHKDIHNWMQTGQIRVHDK